MFDFKNGIQNLFESSAEKLTARGLGASFAAKASGPVVRTPTMGVDNTFDM